MARLMSLTLAAFVCCVTLAVVTSTGMYPQPYMMQGIKGGYYGAPMVYPAYPAYGYGNQGFSPVGQGGIMEFFFMLIFLMFMMELFQGFGNNNNGYGDY